MRRLHWILATLLLLLIGGAAYVLYRTRPVENGEVASKPGRPAPVRVQRTVDTKPLQTIRHLASLAESTEEQEYARQIIRLADHEVSLAYANAVRQALLNPRQLTDEVKRLAEAKEKAEDVVEADQALLKKLNREVAMAQGKARDALEDQLEVAKAQFELDKDELAEAADDLERAGGDPQARVKRLKEVFDALQKGAAESVISSVPQDVPSHSFAGRIHAWRHAGTKRAQLEQARLDLQTKLERMTKRREDMAKRVAEAKDERTFAKEAAADFAKKGAGTIDSRYLAKETLSTLKVYMLDQKVLADMTRRQQDLREMMDLYVQWQVVAETQARAALHEAMRRALQVLGILAGVFVVVRLADLFFHRAAAGRRTASSIRTVTRMVVRLAGFLAIIFITFGIPKQIGTILGLAGAGLTVALKDVILGIFGWFVLQGRNGIRVGDWVEIKGVGGEVVEIGVLRTIIMETGAWADTGHPTGRRVTFSNTFAVEGHYFNFTTSGQWLWDELKFLIPTGKDPYPVMDGVQRLVEEYTEANARLAEAEWKKETRKYHVHAFTATPSLNVVPSLNGLEVHVRYISRAFERHDTRHNLYQAVLEVLQGKRQG